MQATAHALMSLLILCAYLPFLIFCKRTSRLVLVFACGFLFSFTIIKLVSLSVAPYQRLLANDDSFLLETIKIPYLLILLGFAACLNIIELAKLIKKPA